MNTRPLTVLFLWHMHQPFYKDGQNGTYVMPWVRLHATKGYYDMPQVMERWGIKGCINMVPSLIEQIEDHVKNAVTDRWRVLTLKRPEEMDEEEKAFVIRNFFMLCWDRLVKTSPRYWEILSKRERFVGKLSWIEMTRFFTNDEILDLQVLFNLKWFGFMARERYPFLRYLDEKDRRFTHEEKHEMMRIQEKILQEIIPLYRRLAASGALELSFTPFYHPVLPLIYDSDIARRSSPAAPLPARFSWPDDARWHLAEGKRYAESVWGMPLRGMWPAEGGVAPEIMPLAAESGVKWLATDEGILFRSVSCAEKKQVLYRPWRAADTPDAPVVFFRDKFLSDLIGFSFAHTETDRAVESFMGHLRGIRHALPDEGPASAVTVALDGENAWENYPDNGGAFLNHFFKTLAEASDFATDTFTGFLEKNAPVSYPVLPVLHSGSWIESDFMIWIGNEEDNTAWEHLRRARLFLDDQLKQHPEIAPEKKEEAFRAIYRAEGSDWFWWYGPQFQTENDYLFDRLFRRHLRRMYAALGQPHPTILDLPIKQTAAAAAAIISPSSLISPRITGRADSFYDWAGAGIFDNTRRPGGAMYHGSRLIREMRYGFDAKNLYFRVVLIDSPSLHEHKQATIRCYLVDGVSIDFHLPMLRFELTPFPVTVRSEKGEEEVLAAGEAAFTEVLDVRLSIGKIGARRGATLACHFKVVLGDGTELERIPEVGALTIPVPTDKTVLRFWDI